MSLVAYESSDESDTEEVVHAETDQTSQNDLNCVSEVIPVGGVSDSVDRRLEQGIDNISSSDDDDDENLPKVLNTVIGLKLPPPQTMLPLPVGANPTNTSTHHLVLSGKQAG